MHSILTTAPTASRLPIITKTERALNVIQNMKTPEQIIEEFREKFPLNINRTIGWNTAMYYILNLIRERDEEWKEKMISKNLKGERNRVISMIRTEEQIKLREMVDSLKLVHIHSNICNDATIYRNRQTEDERWNAALDKVLARLE